MPTIICELFVYGSLRSGRLRRRLLGREIESIPAWLEGFASLPVAGSPYLGLVRLPGGWTEGELLLNLNRRDLLRLDRYEGPQYERRLVWVEAQGRRRCALVYWWRDRRRLRLRSCRESGRFAPVRRLP